MPDLLDRLKTALADRYAIQEELGAGGMATVYLARDLKHKRKVAVKVLRPELAAVLGAERFLKEIEVTANLQHPNILPLYDSGEADTFLYYVMPYIEGETLRDKLNREKQLAVEETVEIAKSVAGALSFAHERGVIHRDIKPENILLQSGQALVADFGIALAVSQAGGTRLTETGLSLGTPHYMSPEQATGDRELDARSDVYSLGATVYEMLVGDPPHIGSSAQAIIAKILSEKPSPITQSRDLMPANVDAAVQKALAKSPADRFTTAAKFAEALTNPAFTLPTTQAAAVTGVPVLGSWNRMTLGFATGMTVMALLAMWGWLRPRPEPPRSVSRYSIALPAQEQLFGDRWAHVALSPDGERLVYPGENEGQLLVRARDELHATPLPGTEGAVNPFFSPDGARVGFFTDIPRALKVVSLGGGPPITVVEGSGVGLVGATWGRDGYLYADGSGNGPLIRVSVSGGPPQTVTALDTASGEMNHFWPDMLPNRKGVLFTASYGGALAENNIAVLDLATGEHEVLVRGVYARYAVSGHLVYVTVDGTLMVAPFDQDALALTGEPMALVEGVSVRAVGAVDLAVSATGTLTYTTRRLGGEAAELVWVTRDGTAHEIDPGWRGNFLYVSLSPDGTKLAVSSGYLYLDAQDIWIKQLDRGPLSRLTFEGSLNYRPSWTPDGRAVTFISNRGQNQDLYVKRADGSAVAEVLLDEERSIDEGFYSRDGDWLVYRVGGGGIGLGGTRDLYAIRPGVDTVGTPLVKTVFEERAPALSPDGRWLAYVSDESGALDIYVRPFPNANDGKWLVSTDGGREPAWAHSGRELFYRNGANEMVAVDVLPGTTFRYGEEQVLFSAQGYVGDPNHATYDVAADDRRFVMIRLVGDVEERELIMVENWFEELKTKVGN